MPWSASALVTGAMALAMSQMIAPEIDSGDTTQLVLIAARRDGQWITMCMLWALSSVCFILGTPSVMTLLRGRGRLLGALGCVVFAIGAIGLSGLAGFALVIQALSDGGVRPRVLDAVLADPGLRALASVWVIGLFLGFVVIAAALLVARSTPRWIPVLLPVFVAVELVFDGNVVAKVGYAALVVAFTGIAIHAVDPGRRTQSATSSGSMRGTNA